jgi:hypothetical protein
LKIKAVGNGAETKNPGADSLVRVVIQGRGGEVEVRREDRTPAPRDLGTPVRSITKESRIASYSLLILQNQWMKPTDQYRLQIPNKETGYVLAFLYSSSI